MGKSDYYILLVDDDTKFLEVYERIFKLNNYKVLTSSNGLDALKAVDQHLISLLITDIIMPSMDGLTLLKKAKAINPKIQTIMLTAEGSVHGAVDAMKLGAYTYIEKPINIDELLLNVKRAIEIFHIHAENINLKKQLDLTRSNRTLLGKSRFIEEIKRKIDIVAKNNASVLVTGESGTGKEIIANQIHYKSKRANQPFIKVNCAALAKSVLESELFGHEKGAFTGATESKKGRFEMADKGTLMLDEIGEMPLSIQVKLLRVLQEKELERVGGIKTIKTDFRLIAVTNKNLESEVQRGRFREDLYYRINVVPIHVCALKERKEDIPILINYFYKHYCQEMGKNLEPIHSDIMNIFTHYNWHGNVRELKNLVERLVVFADTHVKLTDLPESMTNTKIISLKENTSLKNAREHFEKQFIINALRQNDYHVINTASAIDIAAKNLYAKIKKYNITLHT